MFTVGRGMLAADGFSEVLSAWGNVDLGEGITSCAIAPGEEEMEEESPCYGHSATAMPITTVPIPV
eukprot:5133785-Lingulodinium_polyedra.AAC.1